MNQRPYRDAKVVKRQEERRKRMETSRDAVAYSCSVCGSVGPTRVVRIGSVKYLCDSHYSDLVASVEAWFAEISGGEAVQEEVASAGV